MPSLLRQIDAVPESPWLAVEALCDGDRAAEEALRQGAHPNETRRWESVVAQPVFARLGGASRVPVAVLTSPTTWRVTDADTVDRWSDVMAGLAEEWGERLVARLPA
jgi:predicted secreted protein